MAEELSRAGRGAILSLFVEGYCLSLAAEVTRHPGFCPSICNRIILRHYAGQGLGNGFAFVASGTRRFPRRLLGLDFHSFQPLTPDSHSFSTAIRARCVSISDSFPDNSYGELCSHNGEPWRFRVHAQAAGGQRPHHWRLHQAEEGRGAELFGAVSVSWGEDGVVLSARHAAVLSLLRLRRLGGRFQLRAENRKHHLPRSRSHGGAEARDSSAQGQLFDSGRSQRSAIARAVARRARAGGGVFSGVLAASGGRAGARIPGGARAQSGNDCALSHWLCSGFRVPPARSPEGGIQRGSAAGEWVVFVEAGRPASGFRRAAGRKAPPRRGAAPCPPPL